MTRSTDRLLVGLLVAVLVAAAAGALPALYLLGQDLRASGEFLDGLGVIFGLMLLAVVAAPATVAVFALRVVRQSRPRAKQWAIAAGVVAAVAVLPYGFFAHGLFVVLVLPGVLTLVAATADAEA